MHVSLPTLRLLFKVQIGQFSPLSSKDIVTVFVLILSGLSSKEMEFTVLIINQALQWYF